MECYINWQAACIGYVTPAPDFTPIGAGEFQLHGIFSIACRLKDVPEGCAGENSLVDGTQIPGCAS